MSDPFATATIRQRVLAGWAAAPVRLREDANAEEDLALGGYRDRLVVELAQNAADAAARAGIPGHLSLTVREQDGGPSVLVAANTGAPLSAEGVQSLATLRASAKSGERSVGRFGVGFAAVLAVTDEPAVLSRTGGVRFSARDTAMLVSRAAAEAPELAAEVRRRDGHVPVLRLPFACAGSPPAGFDTAVVLPLRDEVAADAVRRQLAEVDDALLLALPSLAEVVVDVDGEPRCLADVAQRWHVQCREGAWTAQDRATLLASRPTEERRQHGWQVIWALPRSDEVAVPATLHAPTPTDEPLSFTALLLASLPLDPTRRHVAPGPLTDRLLVECAATYADLLRRRAIVGDDVLSLVPTGLPAGGLDAALREHVLALLVAAPVLLGVEDGTAVRPRDAVALDVDADPSVLAALAPHLAGLVAAPRSARAALAALGVQRVALADVIEALPAQGGPAQWHALYDGIAPLADDANSREALSALPVPLVDGRVVRGPRGLLVPGSTLSAEALEPLAPFGLRIVHPKAGHQLLARLGAVPATARSVLEDPAVRVAVEQGQEGDDGWRVTDAVLKLVRSAVEDGGLHSHELPWLRELALPDDEGELAVAGALVLAGSPAADLLDLDEVGVLDPGVAEEWPREVLLAVGVLDGLAVVRAWDVDVHDPPQELTELDGFADWARHTGDLSGVVGDFVAVRDLDIVRPERWPEALQHMASEPELRRALLARAGYTPWWLRRELGLDGAVVAAEDDLGGLLRRAPAWVESLDAHVRGVLGLVDPSGATGITRPLTEQLLTGLADPALSLSAVSCLRGWRLLAQADEAELPAPQRIRVLDGAWSRVVEPVDAVVADDPRWLQRRDLGGMVVPPAQRAGTVADLLDIDLASERAPGEVVSKGTVADVPEAVRDIVPTAPGSWVEHEDLCVDGHSVDWWVEDDGTAHASTYDGLARALAWSAGQWRARHALVAVLADPASAAHVAAEDCFG